MLWGNYQIYLMILYGILFLSDITDKIYEFMDSKYLKSEGCKVAPETTEKTMQNKTPES